MARQTKNFDKKAVIKAYLSGMSAQQVERVTGVSKTSALKILRAAGVVRTSKKALRMATDEGRSGGGAEQRLAPEKAEAVAKEKNRLNCERELELLRKHHPELEQVFLRQAMRALEDRSMGVDITGSARGYAQRLEAANVQIRSTGNGGIC